MRDILAPESARWRRFTQVFAEVVEAAGYQQIIPPLMEDLGVFTRIGEADREMLIKFIFEKMREDIKQGKVV